MKFAKKCSEFSPLEEFGIIERFQQVLAYSLQCSRVAEVKHFFRITQIYKLSIFDVLDVARAFYTEMNQFFSILYLRALISKGFIWFAE